MNRFKTDFTNVEEFELPKEGQHLVTVVAVSPMQSSKGNDMILFELETKKGWKLYHYCLNTESNRWMLKKTLEAITGEYQPKGPIWVNTDDLVGKILKIEVVHEKYEGKLRAKVSDVIIGSIDDALNQKTTKKKNTIDLGKIESPEEEDLPF